MRSWGIGFSEWNSAFLYWTDLLIIALLGLWFLRTRVFYDIAQNTRVRIRNIIFSNYDWFLIAFLAISAVSIKNAINPTLGWYQLLKLVELSLLYFYVKSNLDHVFDIKTSFFVFIASGLFQAVLAILQYVRQADLGLRFLGETVLSPELFNVAVFTAEGEKIMRPYGTTPHPNVLALFLFMAVFICYFFYVKKDKFFHSGIGLFVYSVLLFGLLLTFSRVIVFVWALGAVLKWVIFNKKFTRLAQNLSLRNLTVATFGVLVLFSILFWPQVLARLDISPQEEAVSLRGFYNKISLFEKPFWGVGLGNFVNWFKEVNPALAQNLYQPVHNIYLLIFSETGVLGLGLFLLFLFFLAKNYMKIKFDRPFHYSFFIIFISLLFFGLFDHFLWTLQQGQIIFWLVMGLLAAMSPHSSVDRAQASGA